MDNEKIIEKDSKSIHHVVASVVGFIIFGSIIISNNLESISITTLVFIGFVIAYLWTGGDL